MKPANYSTQTFPLNKKMSQAKTDTLIINLLSGPGAGKSTTASGIFSELKMFGVNTELASEYAKDLVWESRKKTLEDQIYVFGKQYHRIYRLLGQVEVVVTDSPILLTPLYDGEERKALKDLVFHEYNKVKNLNFYIARVKPYNPKGRVHDENEAKKIDDRILGFMNENNLPFEVITGDRVGINKAVLRILPELGLSNQF
jgi:hypothetical protein